MPSVATQESHALTRRVIATIRAYGLIERGDKVLVAVSGGPDSVALLLLLHDLARRWRLSLTVVHCHYGLRGAESDGDAVFVRDLCERLSLPFLLRHVKTVREAGMSSSLQARARDARYRLFSDLAKEMGFDRVALGHTADDQAETVLLRLLRGSGLRGLAGMPRLRNRLFVRPLLGVTRQEILHFLESQGESYRMDSSNAKDLYLRNRIRRDVMPVLKRLVPGVVRILARQGDILREDDEVLQLLARDCEAQILQAETAGRIYVDRAALLEQPLALQRRLLRLVFGRLLPDTPPPFHVVETVLAYLASPRSGATWTWRGLRLTSEPQSLWLELAMGLQTRDPQREWSERGGSERSLCTLTVESIPWTGIWPPTGETISITPVSRKQAVPLLGRMSANFALLDGNLVSMPLTVRSWRPGDWFCPAGMRGRRKKLQDYFTDAKLGRSGRGRVPLVVSADAILWVAGHRVDERFRAFAASERFLHMTITTRPREEGAH